MATTTRREQHERPAVESSHLTVRPENDGPREVRFMFDQPDGQRIGRSLGAGLLTEVVVVGLVLLVMSLGCAKHLAVRASWLQPVPRP